MTTPTAAPSASLVADGDGRTLPPAEPPMYWHLWGGVLTEGDFAGMWHAVIAGPTTQRKCSPSLADSDVSVGDLRMWGCPHLAQFDHEPTTAETDAFAPEWAREVGVAG